MDTKKEMNNNQLTLAINDLIENIQDIFKVLLKEDSVHLHLSINNLLEVWLEFTRRVLPDPQKLQHAQLVYWQDYLLLCKDLQQRLKDNLILSTQDGVSQKGVILKIFTEKFSFLISQHIQVVIKNIFIENGFEANKKIDFYTRQFAEAFAHNIKKKNALDFFP